MNIHEHQAKQILKKYGAVVPEGIFALTVDELVEKAKSLKTEKYVLKAQIHAGGRGKGGGVKLAKNSMELENIVSNILGMHLITPQTSMEGKLVNKVLITEDVYFPGETEPEEFYISILLNRKTGKNMIMYSSEGGMDIESVAEKTPELIFYEDIDPLLGILPFQSRKIAFNLGLSGKAFKEMIKFITLLYKSYVSSDSSLFEINPVLKTSDEKIMAVDASVRTMTAATGGNNTPDNRSLRVQQGLSPKRLTQTHNDKIGQMLTKKKKQDKKQCNWHENKKLKL